MEVWGIKKQRDHWVNMSSDQQSLTKPKTTVEQSEWEKYFMNANKYATETQIKCHSREAIFWTASRAPAIRCYSQTNQQQSLMLMKPNDPYSCRSATHLNKLFWSRSLCCAGIREPRRGGWIQGHRAVSSSPSASLELPHFLSLFRSGFLSCNSIPFRRQALCNITLSLDSFPSKCELSPAVIQFV